MNYSTDKQNGAQVVAKALKDFGITTVYLYPGGTIAPLLNEFVELGIHYVCARNEQGAGYAAIGAAKITGKPQVVMVTSGPGATNLITPIADAYYDSIPIIAITGQVGVSDINFDRKVRQTGFQETDSKNLFTPVTKAACVVTEFQELYQQIADMIQITIQGRPGPILIDMPMSIQRGEVEQEQWTIPAKSDLSLSRAEEQSPVQDGDIERALALLQSAKKPLILAGNGVHIANANSELKYLVETMGIPTVCSLPGVGAIPGKDPLYKGFVGHTGEYFANLAAYHADVILVLGARLDLRQTGTELAEFLLDKIIIRVDIDPNELNSGRVKADLKIMGDLKEILSQMNARYSKNTKHEYAEWISTIDVWKNKYNSKQFYTDMNLSSYHIIRAVDEYTKDQKAIVTSGVGTHQQLVARYFNFNQPDRVWMTSAGHGTMGFDLPSVIGALLEGHDYDYGLVFVGDGSFQMNIQELATINNYDLPVKIFVLDNQRLGIVSQFQLMNWPVDESTGRKINPSFSAIGKAYGLKGFDLDDKAELPERLDEIFADTTACVVHCHIDEEEDVLPMLLGGQKMNEMYPFTK